MKRGNDERKQEKREKKEEKRGKRIRVTEKEGMLTGRRGIYIEGGRKGTKG